MSPSRLKSLIDEAVSHHQAGRLSEAEALYARVRAAAPSNFDAVHLSGLVAYQLGRHADAALLLKKALKLDPSSAVCQMRLGLALIAQSGLDEAEVHLKRAAARSPQMFEVWHHLGVLHRAKGRVADAIECHGRAAALNPKFWEAHERLGVLIGQTKGPAEGVPHLRKVCELQPRNATAAANLGVTLAQCGELSSALAELDRALAIEPTHALALSGRALVLQESYRIADAVATYGLAIASNPSNTDARSGRLLAMHYLDGTTREQVFAEHVAFGESVRVSARTMPAAPRSPSGRLRVAFLSPDLRAHSVAYFLEPLIDHMDPERFEIYLYHDHHRVDAVSERLRSKAALWRNFAGMPHGSVEPVIRSDAPDVIVDLAGHTGRNRLPLLARRLAPTQVTYLGYPDTTGVAEMDFRFVDGITDPAGDADRFATERLVRFSTTAWSYAPPANAPAPLERSGDGPVTFGCFNNAAKLSDSSIKVWARILQSVPGSRLLLKGKGLSAPVLAAPLLARFAAAGCSPDRIELVERTPTLADHLSLYSRVDVALDTFPYNGTTTTCEALWMGVPVITLAGDRHASRVGMSLLDAVGHPEWVAEDLDAYAARAAALAGDPDLRRRLRGDLRASMLSSALLDHRGQAERFGSALLRCAGRAPSESSESCILDPVVSQI